MPPRGSVIPGVAGLLLCVGLWTPIAGGALAIFEVWAAFSGKGNFWAEILLAVISAALAMLGPGTWSIDARLFGRKRLTPRPWSPPGDSPNVEEAREAICEVLRDAKRACEAYFRVKALARRNSPPKQT